MSLDNSMGMPDVRTLLDNAARISTGRVVIAWPRSWDVFEMEQMVRVYVCLCVYT